MNVIELLQKAVVDQASDIFIIAGLPVSYRTNGRILREDGERLMPPQTSEFVQQLYELAQGRDLSPLLERGDDDFSFAIPGLSRFRVSAYKQRGALSAVIRVITFDLPHPVMNIIRRSNIIARNLLFLCIFSLRSISCTVLL